MKTPDSTYDWSNAVGKGFHKRGYPAPIEPVPAGIVRRTTDYRVYYTDHAGSYESWCSKEQVALVEVDPQDSRAVEKVVAAFIEARQALLLTFDNEIAGFCN